MQVAAFLYRELGIQHLASSRSPRDLYLLIASRFIRLLGFGSIAPILVLFLQEQLEFSEAKVGLFLSCTLLGDVGLSLLISWIADGVGRRRVLAIGSAMMALSGFTFASSSNFTLLLLSAIFGVISTSGNECGPFSSVEVTIISQLVQPANRVYALVWYQVLGFVGLALGSILSGSAITALEKSSFSTLASFRAVFAFYAFVAIVKVGLSLSLSGFSEAQYGEYEPLQAKSNQVQEERTTETLEVDFEARNSVESERTPLLRSSASVPRIEVKVPITEDSSDAVSTPSSLPTLRLAFTCVLFSIDSFASSLVPASYVSLFFKSVYFVHLATITKVLAFAALGAVLTSLCAGALSKRVGLAVAMTAFHIPAQLMQIAMAFAPSVKTVFSLYIARTCLSSLDSSVRGAFLSAMVPASSRTRFLGIVDVSRSLAAGPGPFVTGRLIKIDKLPLAFVLSGSIKILADIGLLVGFSAVKLEH
ncbi:hypothetical protein JCM5350_006037 [Sporobolomyces pararoseus]